jgi:hypothetical protein
MSNLQTQTVQEYNKSQTSMCMKFQNEDGSLTKRGYVVTFNGESRLFKNKAELAKASEKDFEKEECPIYWMDGLGMSKVEYMNS